MPNHRGVRLLFITTDYPPEIGGLQTYSYRIVRDLPGKLLSHVLVGSNLPRDDLPSPAAGVKLLARKGKSRWRALLWSLWSIPYIRIFGRTDFLLHMQWNTAIPSWLLRKLGMGTRYVVLIHGAEIMDPNRPILSFLKKAVLQGADAVVAGSQYTAGLVTQSGIRCRRMKVIHYGNPLEGCAILKGPEIFNRPLAPRLLCMHRLVPRKGTALLLEALAGMQHISWTLDLIGEGEEEEKLQQQARTLQIANRIHFHPHVSDAEKMRWMQHASVFILPSLAPIDNNHVEGLGLTLLEAQSLSVPVLAARTGGIPEAVNEGVTGVLFKPGDSKDLQEKLMSLLVSPEKLSTLGNAGPDWVASQFSWKVGLGKLAGLMAEIKLS